MEQSKNTDLGPAHRRFAAMAAAYTLGTFNDNFFKQAVMLLAVAASRASFQGMASAAYTIPFIVLAAPAGWLADRYPKRKVVIAAKITEVLAALVGAAGLLTGNLWIMVVMVGLMGIQATFFSPALNGAIPELYPADRVTQANALLRMAVTVGILVGVSLSGIILDLKGVTLFTAPFGNALAGIMVVAVAVLGLLVSLGVPSRPAADPGRPFPWTGPLDTLRELKLIWGDRQLGHILVGDVFVWSVGVFQLLLINTLGQRQFGLDKTHTSLLVASQLLGLGLGGLIAARFAKGNRWFRVLPPAGAGMGVFMIGIALIPALPGDLQVAALYGLIGLAGAAGGLMLIPCESFIQVRPAPERKGTVWASSNFASFSGMTLASVIYLPLQAVTPSLLYGILGTVTLLFTLWLSLEFRRKEWA